MAVQTIKANATLKDKVLVETEARGHKLTIDEPKNLGGTDKGMNPVEVLLAGLGACQSIVARTYAEKFDIRLDAFSVELEGDKIGRASCRKKWRARGGAEQDKEEEEIEEK